MSNSQSSVQSPLQNGNAKKSVLAGNDPKSDSLHSSHTLTPSSSNKTADGTSVDPRSNVPPAVDRIRLESTDSREVEDEKNTSGGKNTSSSSQQMGLSSSSEKGSSSRHEMGLSPVRANKDNASVDEFLTSSPAAHLIGRQREFCPPIDQSPASTASKSHSGSHRSELIEANV